MVRAHQASYLRRAWIAAVLMARVENAKKAHLEAVNNCEQLLEVENDLF